jgi:hypothetical protein
MPLKLETGTVNGMVVIPRGVKTSKCQLRMRSSLYAFNLYPLIQINGLFKSYIVFNYICVFSAIIARFFNRHYHK